MIILDAEEKKKKAESKKQKVKTEGGKKKKWIKRENERKEKFFFFIFKEMYKEKRHGKTPLANRWAADQVGGAKETAKIKVISAWPLIYIYL